VVGTRLLLAIPVLLALAIASISGPAPATATAAPKATAPPAAPAAPKPAPPATKPPGSGDDECACPQQLIWEECEPAWHHDVLPDDRPARRAKRAAPGSQDGPV